MHCTKQNTHTHTHTENSIFYGNIYVCKCIKKALEGDHPKLVTRVILGWEERARLGKECHKEL